MHEVEAAGSSMDAKKMNEHTQRGNRTVKSFAAEIEFAVMFVPTCAIYQAVWLSVNSCNDTEEQCSSTNMRIPHHRDIRRARVRVLGREQSERVDLYVPRAAKKAAHLPPGP